MITMTPVSEKKRLCRRHICCMRGLALGLAVMLGLVALPTRAKAITEDERLELNRQIKVESNETLNWPEGPVVGAESAILIEAETGAILYEKNIHAREYPASTTKILTCLIAAEQCENDEIVTFSKKAVFDTPRGSNNIAIDKGEQLTVNECLQAILIRSANECAFAIAEHIIGGDWEGFADVMNKRAAELGCVDSNFVNPNGLPDEFHYTSAYDLAQIGRAFFDNEMLCEISLMPRLHILPSAGQPDEIIENTTNSLLAGKKYEYKYLVGAKTGYTDDARSCLVACAEKDGLKLISVVMKDEAPNQYLDTISLFDYGFSNFEKVNIAQTETKYDIGIEGPLSTVKDVMGNSTPIFALDQASFVLLPKTTEFGSLETEVSYDDVSENEAAVVNYYYHGRYLGKASVNFIIGDVNNEVIDELPTADKTTTEEEVDDKEEEIVFINVLKIAANVGVVVGIGAILYLIVHGIVAYRKKHPNWRANWKRERRLRKRGKYSTLHEEARKHKNELKAERKRRNKGRRRLDRNISKRLKQPTRKF